jgi:hypothetical protein
MLLSFATGARANAAVPCVPPASESSSHFEGDTDEVPGCPVSGTVHHHHANCGAHQLAAPASVTDVPASSTSRALIAIARYTLPPGHEPGSELDPPQA